MVDENIKEMTEENAPEAEKAEKAAEPEVKAEKKKNKKADPKIAELEEKVAAAEAATEELNDKYMRLYAEYDNFRKRSAREKEGIYADAYADALKYILPII
ncbi:MAG: nucleotide exchange factor GrpE, partial [Clostridia bacterium]|nr:nucleotide exchange factor GrpE [Clostridia bacterium]